jgi:hypothetical protein
MPSLEQIGHIAQQHSSPPHTSAPAQQASAQQAPSVARQQGEFAAQQASFAEEVARGLCTVASPETRTPNPRNEPANSLNNIDFFSKKCRLENPRSLRADARSPMAYWHEKKMRPVDKRAQHSDQQRQTHWRRCVGGRSGYSDSNGFQPPSGAKVTATSQITAGTASTGVCGCWARFTGSAELRSVQSWQIGQAGILPGTDRCSICRRWQHPRGQQPR